jgi:TRAP-type C4-dicarboxylate transport system permease small subunit
MVTLRKVDKLIDSAFMGTCLVLLAVIVVASFVQVFTRYVLNNAVVGSEEICRYAFIWMSMLGSSLCVRRWMHPAVTVVTDFMSPGVRKYFHILVNLLILGVVLVLGVSSLRILAATHNQSSAVLEFRMSHVYLSVPIGCAGMAYNAIVNIAGILTGKGFAGSKEGK